MQIKQLYFPFLGRRVKNQEGKKGVSKITYPRARARSEGGRNHKMEERRGEEGSLSQDSEERTPKKLTIDN